MSVRLDVCRRLISNFIDMYVRATRKVDSSGANLYPEPFACCLKNQFFRSLLFVRVARVRHPVRLALEFPQSLTAPRLRDLPRIRRLLHLPVIAPPSFARSFSTRSRFLAASFYLPPLDPVGDGVNEPRDHVEIERAGGGGPDLHMLDPVTSRDPRV
ncbi:MAG: hypothetical protein H0V77_08030 [Actinobacteria bacterium]|nr:hypothetical protein [Actinomycetota bacterium]